MILPRIWGQISGRWQAPRSPFFPPADMRLRGRRPRSAPLHPGTPNCTQQRAKRALSAVPIFKNTRFRSQLARPLYKFMYFLILAKKGGFQKGGSHDPIGMKLKTKVVLYEVSISLKFQVQRVRGKFLAGLQKSGFSRN